MFKWLSLRRKKKLKFNNRPVGHITEIHQDADGISVSGIIHDPELLELLRRPHILDHTFKIFDEKKKKRDSNGTA